MANTPKLQPGSTVWHRATDTGFETRRSPDATPPAGTGWIRGFRPRTPEEQRITNQKKSDMLKGRVMTPEWRARMSQASKGRAKSPEHREAMRQAQLRRWGRGDSNASN